MYPKNPYASQTANSRYDMTPQPGNPVYSEAWALIETARRMAEAADASDGDELQKRRRMREAMKLNWRLWTIFQSSLTVEELDVPEDIRVNILTLAKFIDKHTVASMAEPSPERLATLIDINRNIGGGLLESLQAQLEAQQPETAVQQAAPEVAGVNISG